MSRKSFSFFLPFFISLGVSVSLGLLVMYFFVYAPKYRHYENILAQVQTAPPATGKSNFVLDKPGAKRGQSATVRTKSGQTGTHQEGNPQAAAPTESGSGKKPFSMERPNKPGSHPVSESPAKNLDQKRRERPNGKFDRDRKTNKPNINPSNSAKKGKSDPQESSSIDTEEMDDTQIRGPAFPRDKSERTSMDNENFDNDGDEDQFSDDSDEEEIPSIDDPEMEDNPLIRALKLAREKQQQEGGNPQHDENEPKKNPFEFLFNRENQTE